MSKNQPPHTSQPGDTTLVPSPTPKRLSAQATGSKPSIPTGQEPYRRRGQREAIYEELLLISANTPQDMVRLCRQMAGQLQGAVELRWQAWTSQQTFNPQHPVRLAIVATAQNARELMLKAAAAIDKRPGATFNDHRGVFYHASSERPGKVAVLFGAQTQPQTPLPPAPTSFVAADEVWRRSSRSAPPLVASQLSALAIFHQAGLRSVGWACANDNARTLSAFIKGTGLGECFTRRRSSKLEGIGLEGQISALMARGAEMFIQVGPGDMLATAVAAASGGRRCGFIPTNLPGQPASVGIQRAMAQMLVAGIELDTTVLWTGYQTPRNPHRSTGFGPPPRHPDATSSSSLLPARAKTPVKPTSYSGLPPKKKKNKQTQELDITPLPIKQERRQDDTSARKASSAWLRSPQSWQAAYEAVVRGMWHAPERQPT